VRAWHRPACELVFSRWVECWDAVGCAHGAAVAAGVLVPHGGVAAVPGGALVRRRGTGCRDQGRGRSHRHGVLPGTGRQAGTGVPGRGRSSRRVRVDRRVPVRVAGAGPAAVVLHRAGAPDRRAAGHAPVGVPARRGHRRPRSAVRRSAVWGSPAGVPGSAGRQRGDHRDR
jgi:hypothetical protein